MAVLSNNDRLSVWAEFMRASHGSGTITKAELRAAVDAIDQWADDNAASFNTAIPQPARGVLTARQKAALLMMVIEQRWRVS